MLPATAAINHCASTLCLINHPVLRLRIQNGDCHHANMDPYH
ncbi:hypothetical protein BN439_3220 [Erwinia amylovora Ea644]|nr:hypothetical protein BN439_3220 [Erwinia amylovora Ea644]CCP08323.1 hypothetical protein BN440_3319 [Erwinia amylovora MR1]